MCGAGETKTQSFWRGLLVGVRVLAEEKERSVRRFGVSCGGEGMSVGGVGEEDESERLSFSITDGRRERMGKGWKSSEAAETGCEQVDVLSVFVRTETG